MWEEVWKGQREHGRGHMHAWTRVWACMGMRGDAQSWTRVQASVDKVTGMCGHAQLRTDRGQVEESEA